MHLPTILAQYQLAADSDSIIIGHGLINTTYKITTPTKDQFILQKINDAVFKNPEAIEQNIKLIASHLQKNHPDYLFPSPLPLPDGRQMLFIADEGYFRIFPFVKNSYSNDFAVNPEQAYEAAFQFAKFSKLMQKFDTSQLHTTLPKFHHLHYRYEQFVDSLQKGNRSRMKEVGQEINFLLPQKAIANKFTWMLQNTAFQLRVMHHDCKISNVLFQDNDRNKALCIIDLDTMMPGYFFSDVGDMIRTYTCAANEEEKDLHTIDFRPVFYQAIKEGYLSQMGDHLTVIEKEHFHFAGLIMIYMQALRFFTDYLNNDLYYGAKYEGHNLNRAKNQIELLKQLLAYRE